MRCIPGIPQPLPNPFRHIRKMPAGASGVILEGPDKWLTAILSVTLLGA